MSIPKSQRSSVATARLGLARLLAASPKYGFKPDSKPSKMDGFRVAQLD